MEAETRQSATRDVRLRLLAALCGLSVAALGVWRAVEPGSASASGGGPAALTGTIVGIENDNFTIQTDGHPTGVINALTQAANAVTAQDYPYVWGGGHAEAGVASVGDPGGPGANGHTLGYDCSGSVAAVLAASGLWPAGGAVPNDAGVIADLLSRGLIEPGPGTPPDEVTLYDDPGVHIFMNIDGRFFGTSDGGGGGNGNGGAGWLDDAAGDVGNPAFKEYHVVPSVLGAQTTYGHDYTFQLPADPAAIEGFLLGDQVTVGYSAQGGAMDLRDLAWVGQQSVTATVLSLSPSGTQLLVQTRRGRRLRLSTTDLFGWSGALGSGDLVTFIYTRAHGARLARRLSIVAVPVAARATGTITEIARNLKALELVTASGQRLVIQTGPTPLLISGATPGEAVQVRYSDAPDGTLTLTSLVPVQTGAGTGSSTTGTGTGTTTTPTGTTPTTTGTATTGTSTTATTPAGTTPAGTSTTGTATTGTGTVDTPPPPA